MGRGDKKTKKGKIAMGSFGKSRPVTKNIKAAKTTKAKNEKEK
jgi:30S ribosomal protein S31